MAVQAKAAQVLVLAHIRAEFRPRLPPNRCHT